MSLVCSGLYLHPWCSRVTDLHGEQRLADLVGSHRRATVVEIAKKKVNAGDYRQVSEQTVHLSLLHMGQCSRGLVRQPMLTLVDH